MKPTQLEKTDKIESIKPAVSGKWLYFSIGITGTLISVLLWYVSLLQSSANLKHIIELQVDHVANDIKAQFELRISALKHVAKHIEEDKGVSLENWQANVTEFVINYGEFNAIALLDSSLKTFLIYPPQRPDINQLYATFASQYLNTVQALQDMQAWISPAMKSMNGKNNVFIVIPLIASKNKTASYLTSMVDIKKILNSPVNNQDYYLTISANKQIVFQDSPQKTKESATTTLNIHGTIWEFTVQPSPHLMSAIKTNRPFIIMLLGVGITILLIIATRLAKIARARTLSLHLANQELKAKIAEHVEAEESNKKLEIELLQGQKLQAIGTLAGGIAHDFNNILYAIMGYVEMAREDVSKDSLIYENLGKVLEGTQRGQELIARILAFSRRHHYELKPIVIQSIIESILGLLKPTIPASVHIHFTNELTKNFALLGDQTRLHHVFVNIINNAVDAMDGEGTVTITLSQVTSIDEQLQPFSDIQEGNYCKIELKDTGHGMDQGMIARIFEPFFTTKEVGKGTGLGLATAHSTVKEHHGEIVVTSQLGQGSTFTIFLPEYIIGE
jgi:signal transduction histidine kinase